MTAPVLAVAVAAPAIAASGDTGATCPGPNDFEVQFFRGGSVGTGIRLTPVGSMVIPVGTLVTFYFTPHSTGEVMDSPSIRPCVDDLLDPIVDIPADTTWTFGPYSLTCDVVGVDPLTFSYQPATSGTGGHVAAAVELQFPGCAPVVYCLTAGAGCATLP